MLHQAQIPPTFIGPILAALALALWGTFDRTPQGIILALFCGTSAPLIELVMNSIFGLWHYPCEDLPGMVSWYDP
jgi:hypothetical protein